MQPAYAPRPGLAMPARPGMPVPGMHTPGMPMPGMPVAAARPYVPAGIPAGMPAAAIPRAVVPATPAAVPSMPLAGMPVTGARPAMPAMPTMTQGGMPAGSVVRPALGMPGVVPPAAAMVRPALGGVLPTPGVGGPMIPGALPRPTIAPQPAGVAAAPQVARFPVTAPPVAAAMPAAASSNPSAAPAQPAGTPAGWSAGPLPGAARGPVAPVSAFPAGMAARPPPTSVGGAPQFGMPGAGAPPGARPAATGPPIGGGGIQSFSTPAARPGVGGAPPTSGAPPTASTTAFDPSALARGPTSAGGPPGFPVPASSGVPPGGMQPHMGGMHPAGGMPPAPGMAVGMGMGMGGMPGGMQQAGVKPMGMSAPPAPGVMQPGMMAPSMAASGAPAYAAHGPQPIAPTVPVAVVNEAHQCRPAYMSFTMGAMPANSRIVTASGLPFGLAVHPLAEGAGSLGPGGLPIVDFGAAGVVRCKKCRVYINPFVDFLDGGHRWRCNMCSFLNDVPAPYFSQLQADGKRADVASRPELSQGSVEFIAPAEYMLRPPQPPVYVFVLDVSYGTVGSGILQTAVNTIRSILHQLPGDDRTQIGFVTFDTTVHFYNLKPSLKAPQMMVVPDVSDLFLPAPEDLLVNLSSSRHLVEALLDSLPTSFAGARSTDTALGAALEGAFQIMQHIGGKMIILQASMPNVGLGKLKARELPKMLGSEQEHQLLAPEPGEEGNFYKGKAVDFSRQQISADMFLFAHNFIDVATLGAVSRYTAGQVYYYPGYTPADAERFSRDFSRNLLRTTGFEAVMRLRTTKGVNVTNFYGNFFIRGADLLALPNVTCDTAFNVELNHEEMLAAGSTVAIQAALLYTNTDGQRRICVHTLCKPVTSVLADLFRNVDVDATCNMIAKVALDHALRTGLHMARRYLHRAVVDAVRAYRAATTSPYGGAAAGGPGLNTRAPLPSFTHMHAAAAAQSADITHMLPENLMLLPLYAMGLQKCPLYRGGEHIRADERSSLVYRMLTMPAVDSNIFVYPRLYSLHDMDASAGMPEPGAAPLSALATQPAVVLPTVVNLTAERLTSDGIFLLDNGVEMYLWIGRACPPAALNALFGISSLDGLDLQSLHLPELANPFSERVNAIVRALREPHFQAQKLRFVREGAGDVAEMRFHWHMVEDKQAFVGGNLTYAEYLPLVNRDSQMAQMGGGTS